MQLWVEHLKITQNGMNANEQNPTLIMHHLLRISIKAICLDQMQISLGNPILLIIYANI